MTAWYRCSQTRYGSRLLLSAKENGSIVATGASGEDLKTLESFKELRGAVQNFGSQRQEILQWIGLFQIA